MTCSCTCTVENKYCWEKENYLSEIWHTVTSDEFFLARKGVEKA